MKIEGNAVLTVGRATASAEDLEADEKRWGLPSLALRERTEELKTLPAAELLRRVLAAYGKFDLVSAGGSERVEIEGVLDCFWPHPLEGSPFGFTIRLMPLGEGVIEVRPRDRGDIRWRRMSREITTGVSGGPYVFFRVDIRYAEGAPITLEPPELPNQPSNKLPDEFHI